MSDDKGVCPLPAGRRQHRTTKGSTGSRTAPLAFSEAANLYARVFVDASGGEVAFQPALRDSQSSAGRRRKHRERFMNLRRQLTWILGRVLGRRPSTGNGALTDDEVSARNYWRKEVADEKEHRGTPEPRED